jgi:hypothetical protein
MPGPDSVGPNEKWRIVIEVDAELRREPTAKFNKAINDAVQGAQTAGTPAKITFNKTVPKTRGADGPGGDDR